MTVDSKKASLSKTYNPLILRYHRLMDAFSKSDDERDFYLDKVEGFIIYVDLDRSGEELDALQQEIKNNKQRYCLIPKLTFYETKKIMEGFVNEKVYDIDIKEKLSDIIQSKEARENFLDFIYDHEVELEKWQQYYQERSRIRIIEWLRNNDFHFVFEEDLELAPTIVEKLKQNLFQEKVGKDVQTARQVLVNRSKVYYSNEALNPRPKRGRPPKQIAKVEVEPQLTDDIYLTVPSPLRAFLYTPDITSASEVTFSAKYDTVEELKANKRSNATATSISSLEKISRKLSSISNVSKKLDKLAEEGEAMPEPTHLSGFEEKTPAKPKPRRLTSSDTEARAKPAPLKRISPRSPSKSSETKNKPRRLIRKKSN